MPSQDFTERCDKILGADGALIKLWPMLAREIHPKWFRSFVTLEADALVIHEFGIQAVPGLLQTKEYARASLGTSWPPKTSEELEEALNARLERQQLLDRKSPPMLWFVLDESIFQRLVGSPAVMSDQLSHLLELAKLPFLRILVLPMVRSGRVPADGPLIMLELPRREIVAYVEGPATARIVAEPDDVKRCAALFDVIRAEALPADESAELIARVRRELYVNS